MRLYVTAVVFAGAIASISAVAWGGSTGDIRLLFSLIVLAAVSERFKVGLFPGSHVSLAAVVCISAAIAGGARDAAIVALASALAVNLGGRVAWYKSLFNMSAYVCSTLAFLGVFAGVSQAAPISAWPESIVPATAGALADLLVNATLVTAAVVLSQGDRLSPRQKRGWYGRRLLCERFHAVMRENYVWLAPHYLLVGALGAAVAAGYKESGVTAVPLFVLGLAGFQFSLAQFFRMKRGYENRQQESDLRLVTSRAE